MNESNEKQTQQKIIFSFEQFDRLVKISQKEKANPAARAILLNALLLRKLHAVLDCIKEEMKEEMKVKSKSNKQKSTKTEEELKKEKQKRIKMAFEEKDRQNVAIAYLETKEFKKHYFANSLINDPNDIDDNSRLAINKIATICYIEGVKQEFPVRRLDVKNLEFYIPNFQGYAGEKLACCERKILAKVLQEAKKNQEIKELKGSKLYLYTKLEPCIYCFKAMKQFIKENDINLFLFYGDLQKELFEQMKTAFPNAQPMIDRLTLIRGQEDEQQKQRWLLSQGLTSSPKEIDNK
ncbi:hypothetical protein [Priestia megaterium]|uniref:hypothetical protein n=1 Tax=Priestia megaterium TaxID=1404 RepID=UPI002364571A|nr:hypothetical protein [Priestia megaterium]MDD1515783.1 hypothetical protein [Priestia megaterium]